MVIGGAWDRDEEKATREGRFLFQYLIDHEGGPKINPGLR